MSIQNVDHIKYRPFLITELFFVFLLLIMMSNWCFAAGQEGVTPKQVDSIIEQYKPTEDESEIEARQKCSILTNQAAAAGVKVLVIGFEGLYSFRSVYVRNAYRYLWYLNNGVSTDRPKVGKLDAGYVAQGTIPPIINTFWNKVETLIYSYDALIKPTRAPLVCAQEWMKNSGNQIVLLGHSRGGAAVLKLTGMLRSLNIPVAGAITLDPVQMFDTDVQFVKHENVGKLLNYYQDSICLPPFNFCGLVVNGADDNVRLSGNHFTVPSDGRVLVEAMKLVQNILTGIERRPTPEQASDTRGSSVRPRRKL